jgi:hypothetical protein
MKAQLKAKPEKKKKEEKKVKTKKTPGRVALPMDTLFYSDGKFAELEYAKKRKFEEGPNVLANKQNMDSTGIDEKNVEQQNTPICTKEEKEDSEPSFEKDADSSADESADEWINLIRQSHLPDYKGVFIPLE